MYFEPKQNVAASKTRNAERSDILKRVFDWNWLLYFEKVNFLEQSKELCQKMYFVN